MPVIIEKKDEDYWLNPDNKEFKALYKLLKLYPENEMKMQIVSKRVNNPKNDDETLIEPIDINRTPNIP